MAEGHSGRICPRSRQCGQNGCKALHHRLLHQPSQETELKTANLNSTESIAVKASNKISSKQTTSGTEGNKPWQQTTMTANNVTTTNFIALRTVPIILKNGNRSIKVNALLDDASMKTERVTVNVLNGQVETFETCPVDVQLESLIGDVKLQVTAYTATRVTGTMSAFDWTEYTQRWVHLQHINFPRVTKRPVVDVLIGLDCADLHCALQEVKGRSGEPIARLTHTVGRV